MITVRLQPKVICFKVFDTTLFGVLALEFDQIKIAKIAKKKTIEIAKLSSPARSSARITHYINCF